MPENKNPRLTPAAVAHQAIGTLILNGGLPPEAVEHLKQASQIILSTPTTSPEVASEDEGGVPIGESVAASKRRAAGEDPDATEDDGETDDAPTDKAKGGKANPLSNVKRWASSPTKDDEPEPAKPKPKASVTLSKGKPRFMGRR